MSEWGRHWPLATGLLMLAIPTFLSLGKQVWSTEAGAHAPIVIATGLWLLVQSDGGLRPHGQANPLLWGLGLLLSLPPYIFGRAFDLISVETAGLYLAFVTIFYAACGWRAFRDNVFPLLYLGFIVPPPGWLIQSITQPLQNGISAFVTALLQYFDYPIVNEGISLYIGQYQLLVEDACAGMNSITGLIAISLFYIYIMHKASLRYAALLTLMIVPVAIFTNFVRVIVLVLITYYFGDAAAQGFLHVTAGLVLFMFAVLIIFALDWVLVRIFPRSLTGAA